jgi:hypothetical protein
MHWRERKIENMHRDHTELEQAEWVGFSMRLAILSNEREVRLYKCSVLTKFVERSKQGIRWWK